MQTLQSNNNGNGLELKNINIDSISILKHHPRSDLGNLEALQGSMRRDGIQDPLLVCEIESGKYNIIDGARRLTAAGEMGWKEILCLIHSEISEADAAHLSYVKNVERKTLNAIEIARHIQTMRDTFGYTLEELELKGYGSPSAISRQLKLLGLPDKTQSQIQEGILTAGHGVALVELPSSKEQERMAKRIVDHDYSVRATKDRVRRYLAKKNKQKKERPEEIIPSGDVPGVYFKDARDMSELPVECVHLLVTSPPYFLGKEYEKGVTYEEHIDNIRAVMDESARTLVPGGIMAINVANINNFKSVKGNNELSQTQLMAHRYQNFLRKHQILLTDTIIWIKRPAWRIAHNDYRDNTVHTSYRMMNNWEPIYIFRKKGERVVPSEEIVLKSKLTREQWMTYVNAVWDIEPVHHMKGHPCIYPDELANRLIRMFSYDGDTVLDPFLGSGTTVKVARELGRHGIGYERELQYKPVIMEKLGIGQGTAESEPLKQMQESVEQIHEFGSETTESEVEMSLEGEDQVPKEGHADGYHDEGKTAQ